VAHIQAVLNAYVTGFDKTRLPHTFNSLTLTICNFTIQHSIDVEFLNMLPLAL